MRYKKLVLFFLLILYAIKGKAQTEDYLKLYLFRYSNVMSSDEGWEIVNEFENTRSFSPDRQREILARTTLQRSIGNGLKAGLGFGYNNLYNMGAAVWVPEWRMHQQVVHEAAGENLEFAHRVRVEQLFARPLEEESLKPGRALTLRARYFFLLAYNLRGQSEKPGNIAAVLWNEVYVFPLKENLFFTENHLNTGIMYQVSDSVDISLSHDWLLLQPSPDVYQYGSIARLTINHVIDI